MGADMSVREAELREQLLTLTQPYDGDWCEYAETAAEVERLSLTDADVPFLRNILNGWRDKPFAADDQLANMTQLAARALAHLQALDALDDVLAYLEPLDEFEDDMLTERMPPTLAAFGPGAIPRLRSYIETNDRLWPRAIVAIGMGEMAKAHEDVRPEVVAALCDLLARHGSDRCLNASLVGTLLDMKAVEAAEVIERAHAADAVDITMRGNWDMVREELGVEGLGLVPEKLASRPIRMDPDWAGTWRAPATKPKVARDVNRRSDQKISSKKNRRKGKGKSR